MRLGDLDAVLEIERVSFATPWSREAFRHELERNRVAGCWVARRAEEPEPSGAGAVVAYLCLWAVADEVHVTNVAVHPGARGQGIGRRLLGTLLAHHRARGAARAFLEVRPGNTEARRLYRALGFREVGRRPGYYVDTGEDALLLEARLDELFPAAP
jgi:ribosomal-protein-alanine N-acetyltransferase